MNFQNPILVFERTDIRKHGRKDGRTASPKQYAPSFFSKLGVLK